MRYYGEESLLSENLAEVSSDFCGLIVVDEFVIEPTPSPTGKVYFRLLSGFPYFEDKEPADIKMTRISMTSTEYIKDKGDSWDLSDTEKNRLNSILRANNCSLWKDMIHSWNNEVESINFAFEDINITNRIDEKLPVPDYTKLS